MPDEPRFHAELASCPGVRFNGRCFRIVELDARQRFAAALDWALAPGAKV